MVDPGARATTAVSDPPLDAVGPSRRRVSRRRTLPGGRAVAGAFLVSAAAVGVFGAYLNATAAPSTSWVVATADISRGTVVTSSMITTTPIDLPDAQQASAVPARDLDHVAGRVALGPVRAGDLLQWTTVLSAGPPAGAATMTFSLPASRVAHRGNLAAGDTIDVLATYGDTTLFVARRIELLSAPTAGDGGTSITIAVDDPAVALAIANALDQAQVHILRSSSDTGDTPPPFRPRPGGNG